MKIRLVLVVILVGAFVLALFNVLTGMTYDPWKNPLMAAHDLLHLLVGAVVGVAIMRPMKKTGQTRYWVMVRIKGVDGSGKNDFANRNVALKRAASDASDPDYTNVLLVDAKRKVVEVKKGDGEVFGRILDIEFPGWCLGKV